MKKMLISTALMLIASTIFATQLSQAKKQKPQGPAQERIFSFYNSTNENVKLELIFQGNQKGTFELKPGEEKTETITARPLARYKLFVKKAGAADYEQIINQKTHITSKFVKFAVTLTKVEGAQEKSINLIVEL